MTQGYIYKLVCLDENIKDTYIGSCWNMCSRHYEHKSRCHNEKSKKYNTPVYQFIREHGGWDNWGMETIEICDCRDKRHLETVEQFYIDVEGGIGFLLNEKDAVQDKEQRKINDSICKSKPKQCECGIMSTSRNLAQHKKSKRHIKKMVSSSFGT